MTVSTARRAHSFPCHDVHDYLRAVLREGGVELLPMPQVATRIVSLAFDPSADQASLASLVERDPTLAGHVMRVANSAAYRPAAPLASLQQAVSRLGEDEVQNLAAALAIRGQVFSAPGHENEVEELWHEGVAAALWAREIARMRNEDTDVAYLCGLLHGVGRTAVIRAVSRVEAINSRVFDTRGLALLLDEFEADFAHRISGDWRLPPIVAAAVTSWRNFAACGEFRHQAALTHAAVQLATASLHPHLLTTDFLSSNPVFAALGVQARLEELLGHSDAVVAYLDSL